jgi:hypothetical protein
MNMCCVENRWLRTAFGVMREEVTAERRKLRN